MTVWNAHAVGPIGCRSSLELPRDFSRASRRGAPAGMWLIRKVAPRLVGAGNTASLQSTGASAKLELQMYISSKLCELRSLDAGWDDGHADSISQSVTHQAYRVLDHLTDGRSVYPFLTPTVEGGVLAEWRAGKERLEIEFSLGEAPYIRATNIDGDAKISGYLGDKQITSEAKQALKDISLRVWANNPTWKRLFV